MFDRRTFGRLLVGGGMLAGGAFMPALARVQGAPSRTTPFYASVGSSITLYDLDVEAGSLTPRNTIQLPSNLQYAWPAPSKRFLYAVTDKEGMGGADLTAAGLHYGLAFRIDPATGALTPHGPKASLPQRPIHMSLDRTGRFMLTAYNTPSKVTVHRINADGTIGVEVQQPDNLDFGNYGHQIRLSPSNKVAILVTRGNNPTATRPENPGAVKVFGFEDGKLSNIASLAPGGSGFGFGPRHMDFDPKSRFAYFSLERNNRLDVYGMKPDSTLTQEAIFMRSTLRDPNDTHISGQGPGPIHAHPNGRIVYVANRSERTAEWGGKKVWIGGEDNIAVFSIDQQTGEPTLIQTADTLSIEPRTFAIDPSMKILVAASQEAMPVLTQDKGAALSMMSAALTVFRIADDGKLTFVRKYDVDTACCKQGEAPFAAGIQFWCGTLAVA